MLSDYPLHFFGRSIPITEHEQFLALVFTAVAVTTWVIMLSRRRRAVVLHRSAVSDQVVYELSRIADALDRLASRPMDQTLAAATGSFKEDEPRTMPFSMFGRER